MEHYHHHRLDVVGTRAGCKDSFFFFLPDFFLSMVAFFQIDSGAWKHTRNSRQHFFFFNLRGSQFFFTFPAAAVWLIGWNPPFFWVRNSITYRRLFCQSFLAQPNTISYLFLTGYYMPCEYLFLGVVLWYRTLSFIDWGVPVCVCVLRNKGNKKHRNESGK